MQHTRSIAKQTESLGLEIECCILGLVGQRKVGAWQLFKEAIIVLVPARLPSASFQITFRDLDSQISIAKSSRIHIAICM